MQLERLKRHICNIGLSDKSTYTPPDVTQLRISIRLVSLFARHY